MTAHLQFVEIPGLADAVRREADVRRSAWVATGTTIAGVRVRSMTLRDLTTLEEMRNGFCCPWRFDTVDEMLGHAAQLVWWLSDLPKPPLNSSRVWHPIVMAHRAALLKHLAQRPAELINGVQTYLRDTFMDAPKGAGTSGAPVAGSPAYIADTLAAGGLFEGIDAMMDAPLVRTWQLMRLAARRVYGVPVTNDSDKLACDYLARLNQQGAN
jgi:hypothetical protein